jgi:hypothetical protein
MKKKIFLPLILLFCVTVSGCASRPAEIPTATDPPPTATIALDADTLSTLLFEAIKAPDAAEVARLLAAGAPVDQPIDMGITPLMVASVRDDADMIRLLLDAGADPEIRSAGGLTALIIAAQQDKAGSIRALVEGGAQIDAVDGVPNHNNTAFCWAVYLGNLKAVKELIALGADINFIPGGAGDTPVITAVRANRVEALKLLLEAKADVNIPNKSGKTAMYYAKLSGNGEIIALLEAAGARE